MIIMPIASRSRLVVATVCLLVCGADAFSRPQPRCRRTATTIGLHFQPNFDRDHNDLSRDQYERRHRRQHQPHFDHGMMSQQRSRMRADADARGGWTPPVPAGGVGPMGGARTTRTRCVGVDGTVRGAPSARTHRPTARPNDPSSSSSSARNVRGGWTSPQRPSRTVPVGGVSPMGGAWKTRTRTRYVGDDGGGSRSNGDGTVRDASSARTHHRHSAERPNDASSARTHRQTARPNDGFRPEAARTHRHRHPTGFHNGQPDPVRSPHNGPVRSSTGQRQPESARTYRQDPVRPTNGHREPDPPVRPTGHGQAERTSPVRPTGHNGHREPDPPVRPTGHNGHGQAERTSTPPKNGHEQVIDATVVPDDDASPAGFEDAKIYERVTPEEVINGEFHHTEQPRQRARRTSSEDPDTAEYRPRKLHEHVTPAFVNGDSLKTWSLKSEKIERVEVLLKSAKEWAIDVKIELWNGPDDTPQTLKLYSKNGNERPFRVVLPTPNSPNTVAIRNQEKKMPSKPIAAFVAKNPADYGQDLPSYAGREILSNGFSETFAFEQRSNHRVESVQIRLETTGKWPMDARVEVLGGSQVANLVCADGTERPFFLILETPSADRVAIKITNRNPDVDQPLRAWVVPNVVGYGESGAIDVTPPDLAP